MTQWGKRKEYIYIRSQSTLSIKYVFLWTSAGFSIHLKICKASPLEATIFIHLKIQECWIEINNPQQYLVILRAVFTAFPIACLSSRTLRSSAAGLFPETAKRKPGVQPLSAPKL